ncbi:MAG: GAF domain-containing protein [Chloroflexota bacterium]
MKSPNVPNKQIRSYTILVALGWTAIVLVLFWLSMARLEEHVREIARVEARTGIEKDLLYRRWATGHGGVYVPVTDDTQPNPYLDVPEREITTPSGRLLTLINPAYMTRQVYELAVSSEDVRAHLTSLKPINPINSPDAWEAEALRAFESGVSEVSAETMMDGEKYIRLIRPFLVEPGCLKCHAKQGYEVGDVRGGLSVSIPLAKYIEIERTSFNNLAASYGTLWLLGLLGIVTVYHNIKKRLQQQEKIARQALESHQQLSISEARYRALFEQAHDGVFILDLAGRHVTANQRGVDMLGYSLEELKQITAFETSAETEKSGEIVTRLLAGEAVPLYERQFRKKNGEIFPAEINVELVHDADARPLHIQSVVRDISERKRAEETLRRSEEQFRNLYENATIGLYRTTPDGSILLANPALVEMLGFESFEDLAKRNLEEDYNATYRRRDFRAKIERDGEVRGLEAEWRRKDGSSIFIRESARLMKDHDGNILYYEGTVEDVTERKRAENALLEKEKFSQSLLRLSRDFEQAQTYGDILRAAKDEISKALGYQSVWVYLLSEDKQQFTVLTGAGEVGASIENLGFATLPIGEDRFLQEIAEARHIVIVEDARTDERTNKEIVAQLENRTIINVPVMLFDKHIATLGTGTFGAEGVRPPNIAEQEYLSTLASHLAVSLDRIHLLDERARTEAKLRENESLLVNAQKIARLGHYVLNLRTGAWKSSAVLSDIFGIDPAYPTDVNGWMALIHPEQRDQVTAYFMKTVLQERQTFDLEFRIKRVRDGELRWVHGLGEVECDADGIPFRLIGTIQDVTERKQREREIESFLEISQAIGASLELQPLLAKILSSAIRGIPNAEKGTILLLNDEHQLEIRTSVGYSDPRVVMSSISQLGGYSAKAFRELRPVLVPDALAEDDIRYTGDVEEIRAIKSAIATPLIVQDSAIGVIAIDNATRTEAFTTENLRVLTTLASSAALAIENARLFDETSRRLTELEALHTISASLRLAQTLEEALPIILDETLRALNTNAGKITLYDPGRDELQDAVRRGWFEKFPKGSLKPGEGVAGTVFRSGQIHLTNDFASDPLVHPHAREYLQPGWGGACVPIRTALETIGVFFVSVPLPRRITHEQLKILNSLAEMTGATLHRMRLNEETSRRAREFAALYQTSTTISGEHDLNSLLETIVRQITTLLHASGGGMYLFDPINEELENRFATETSFPIGMKLKLGEGMAGRVALTRQPLRIDDYSTWEGRSNQINSTMIHAVLEVPMLYAGELIGVLVAEELGYSARKFSEDDERLLSLFAAQAAGAIRSTRLYEETVRRVKYLQALRSIDRAITANMDSNVTLKILLNQAITHMNISAADILLFNTNTLTLDYTIGQGFRTRDAEHASIRLGESYAGFVALERRMLSLPDISSVQPGDFKGFLKKEGFVSCHIAPMIAKGQMRGVLEIYSRERNTFDNESFEFMEGLATQAAIAVDNAQLFKDLQHTNFELTLAYDATIEGWSHALDQRMNEEEGHSKRLADWTVHLARAAGIEERVIGHMRRGAMLHDVGNMVVPDTILQKSSTLTEEELGIVRQHPEAAHKMMANVNFLHAALDIPYCHHERWDGTGYPRGLAGDQIPLAARIFAIVDVWDALTSKRPHRPAWPRKEALAYLSSQSGKSFDPGLVELFLQIVDKIDGPRE